MGSSRPQILSLRKRIGRVQIGLVGAPLAGAPGRVQDPPLPLILNVPKRINQLWSFNSIVHRDKQARETAISLKLPETSNASLGTHRISWHMIRYICQPKNWVTWPWCWWNLRRTFIMTSASGEVWNSISLSSSAPPCRCVFDRMKRLTPKD
jgi:hypothetical protein